MPERRKRVLTVGLSAAEFSRIAPALDRSTLEVDRFPSARGALELLARQRLDVLLVRYPLPDVTVRSFLSAVRGEYSPCRHSPVLLLTREQRLAAAGSHIGRGASRVAAIDGDPDAINAAVAALVDVAPRKPCRFVAQLKVKTGRDFDWILCRTRNGSASGVLLETERRPPAGTRVDFEFTLPGMPRAVAGRGEVARLTHRDREPVHGIGMRFLSFTGDSRRSYQSYLNGG